MIRPLPGILGFAPALAASTFAQAGSRRPTPAAPQALWTLDAALASPERAYCDAASDSVFISNMSATS